MNNLNYNQYKIVGKEDFGDIALFRMEGNIPFNPGQFIQVALDHYGEATFAICSDPNEKSFFEFCIRACGNTTNQLVKCQLGDIIKIRGPHGNSWPVDKIFRKNILIITGGIGLFPIRPLIYKLTRKRKANVHLISGFRDSENIVFEKELLDWKKKFNVDVWAEHVHSGFWGEHGMITTPIRKLKIEKNTAALICGPETMVRPVVDELTGKIDEENILISFERRMECGVGICQHCNIGKYLVCKDGPVFSWKDIKDELDK